MKHLLSVFFLSLLGLSAFAKDGYNIKVNFKQNVPDGYVYLAHYYAKAFPTVYKTDSAKVTDGKTAIFKNKDSILGGIYLVLFDSNARFFDFVLNNGDKMEISVDTMDMPKNIVFKNSPENTRYMAYELHLKDYGNRRMELMDEYKAAKTEKDTQSVRDKFEKLSDELRDYRESYIKKYPGTYLSSVFNALLVPEVPDGPHYLPGTKTIDSNFTYTYYKSHYWDNFDFSDNRLMFTPLYEPKLDEYFNKLVLPIPDSVNAEADTLLAKTRGAKELFKYTLYWLARNAEDSKIMGMDEVFVHLVENYYMKGDAFWLDSASLAKYEDRAKKIAPNVLGNIAPDLNLQDIWTLKDIPLKTIKSKYTLVIFWSPDCGHCQKEIPLLDSLYNHDLKQKGVSVYSIPTEGDLTKIQEFVKQYKISDWTNVVDANHTSTFKKNYDVFSTPKIYLLDQNKVIIGKGLDHTNILQLLEWQEKKAKNKS
jgi:thiol-disulfide isomerase/thioredoxin